MATLVQPAAVEETRRAAAALLAGSWSRGSEEESSARGLLPRLRGLRLFPELAQLCDRILRLDPKDAKTRRLLTQALIETGHPTAAAEVARAALRGLPESDPEWCELYGLIGRASKQILMESRDPGDQRGQETLRECLAAYEKPFRRDPANVWQAINLVAVASFARRMKWRLPAKLDPEAMARQVIAGLEAGIARDGLEKCGKWGFATLAEAHLALGDLDGVERWLQSYLAAPDLEAFDVASTLRQFSRLWGFEGSGDQRREGILQSLHARLLSLPGAQISYSPQELTELAAAKAPKQQLEKILGAEGTKSYDWWKKGLARAASVGAVYSDSDKRTGTCFLVRGQDFGVAEPGSYVLTNAHVVADNGSGGALRPEDATIAFEALDPRRYRVDPQIVRFSAVDRHDACLLRLEEEPAGALPLPLARALPLIPKLTEEETAKPGADLMRVYVIGYPAGGGLEFSLQDNQLLDHEGVTAERPCRVHYRAPTEPGSSGSPVFNRGNWEVIALHHLGGELSRLNGTAGSYPANEGISIFSIAAEFKSR